MITHFFAGSLIFLFLGQELGLISIMLEKEYKCTFLLYGAFIAHIPDYVSLALYDTSEDKWAHLHRDNMTHSIFLPFIIAVLIFPFFGWEWSLLHFITLLSHPVLDLFGIGWGVKLFYPFSDLTFKLFYKGKFLSIFTPSELEVEVLKFGRDDWLKAMMTLENPRDSLFYWGIIEYLSLFGVIALLTIF